MKIYRASYTKGENNRFYMKRRKSGRVMSSKEKQNLKNCVKESGQRLLKAVSEEKISNEGKEKV